MANTPPMPVQDHIANPRDWKRYPKPFEEDPNEGLVSDPWAKWLQFNNVTLQNTPRIATPASHTTQSASITTTAFLPGSFNGGLYRLTFYAEVTTAATTSSSLEVTFLWTAQTLTKTATSTAMTGNTTTTVNSGSFLVLADPNTPISYSTTYSSVGATSMVYNVYLLLENMTA